MKQEILDIFDENMNFVGTAPRSEAHKNGYWHQTFQTWIIFKEQETEYILFQKRHKNKQTYPGYFDITAAGHLSSGENVEDGVREIEEELGVKVTFEKLISLGIDKHIMKEPTFIDKEFCNVFLYECNIPLDKYVLQSDEVSAIVKVTINDALKFFNEEIEVVEGDGIEIDNEGNKSEAKFYITKENVVPCEYKYYLKVLMAAKNYFDIH